MALLWTIHEILMIFFYNELEKISDADDSAAISQNSHINSETENMLSVQHKDEANSANFKHGYQNGIELPPKESVSVLSWSYILYGKFAVVSLQFKALSQ